jgi:hypothetical protein
MDELVSANLDGVEALGTTLFLQEEEGVQLTSFPGVNDLLSDLKERVSRACCSLRTSRCCCRVFVHLQ